LRQNGSTPEHQCCGHSQLRYHLRDWGRGWGNEKQC
jgi:hypothetical protein